MGRAIDLDIGEDLERNIRFCFFIVNHEAPQSRPNTRNTVMER